MATMATSVTKAGGDTVTAANNNSVRLDALQLAGDYATSGGSANAYTLSIDAAIAAYATGGKYRFKANFTNTDSATLNVNSIGAKTMKKFTAGVKSNLAAGDIQNGQIVDTEYDGTDLLVVSQLAQGNDQRVTIFTAGENIDGTTTPQAVMISDGTNSRTSGRPYKADADDSTNEARSFYGFVTDNVTTGNAVAVKRGIVAGFTSLTVGSYYWVTNTAGGISTTPGTAEICVGRAISTTQIDTDDKPAGWMFISSTTNITAPSKGSTTTTTAPAIARFAVITDASAKGSVTIAKLGVTDASDANGPSNATNDIVGFGVSWSGTTLTITNRSQSGSSGNIGNLNVYYYR